jgi:hypothetical protein
MSVFCKENMAQIGAPAPSGNNPWKNTTGKQASSAIHQAIDLAQYWHCPAC